jgi:hypothetical protein
MYPQDVIDWMSTVESYVAENCISDAIDSVIIFSFVWFVISFVCFQKFIQVILARMAKNQKILEDKYMGAELI